MPGHAGDHKGPRHPSFPSPVPTDQKTALVKNLPLAA